MGLGRTFGSEAAVEENVCWSDNIKRQSKEAMAACAGKQLPDDRLAAEFAVVYQGGTETTSLTTTWAM